MIAAWHNIPLFSFIFLQGRCKHCRQPISLRYPFVECLCMVLSVFAGMAFGFNITLIFALGFIWLMISMSFIDLKHQLLPDSLTLGLLWLGLLANTRDLFAPLNVAVLSTMGAYLSLWLLIKLFYLCTGKTGMGHGDFKLFAALGAWFGWTQLPFILMFSSLSGLIGGLIYIKVTGQPRETPIPFGPFLCLAGLISLLYGKKILSAYLAILV